MMRKSITALYSAALSNEEKVKKREMDSTKELPPNPILEEVKSNTVLYSAVLSNDVRVKNIAIDSIRDLPPNAILERVQRGLARLTENIPRPILITVVAVASGLLFFELSKALLLLALPVIAVLGKNCVCPHSYSRVGIVFCVQWCERHIPMIMM